MVGIFDTVAGWAKNTWNSITGAAADLAGAITDTWHYVTSVHNLLAWLFYNPVLLLLRALLDHGQAGGQALTALYQALARVPGWIWAHQVKPVRDDLLARIAALWAWVTAAITAVYAAMLRYYLNALAYTRQQVGIEHRAMLKQVSAEHAAMITRVNWALQTVQQQASSGYNTGTPDRKNIIQSLLTDLAERDPVVSGLAGDIVGLIIDIEVIDNPLIRWTIAKLLREVVSHLGIDQVISDMIGALIGPLAGNPKPRTLYDVERDVAARLAAIEEWQARFMKAGGPELEQAGKGWKDLTGLVVDAAVLSYIGLAVRDPAAWATVTNDTIGVTAADAMTGIVDLISRA